MNMPSRLSIFKHPLARWSIAIALAALALLAARELRPLLGELAPLVIAFPVVAVVAWRCGLGPCFASIAIALLGAKYWFIPPLHSFRVVTAREAVTILACAAAFCLVAIIGESRRRENEALLNAQEELEEKVERRTVELKAASENLSELTARLLKLQDDERRRIARDLHDSIGQTMAVLSVNLSNVETEIECLMKTVAVVKESQKIVQETTTDLRTLSYLLHPPLLDEHGLSFALPWYTKGFGERSGIEVDLEFPEDLGRLSRDSEVAIFRVIQESLTNIHKHSEARHARIRISRLNSDVQVLVEDDGKGIPSEKLSEMASGGMPGVGIRGMRERIRQLGGSLRIDSKGTGKGAVIAIRMPFRASGEGGALEDGSSSDESRALPPAAGTTTGREAPGEPDAEQENHGPLTPNLSTSTRPPTFLDIGWR